MTSPVTRFCQSGDMRRRECILGATAPKWAAIFNDIKRLMNGYYAASSDAIERRVHPDSTSNSCGFWSVVGRHDGVYFANV